jgi:hypothetical protein
MNNFQSKDPIALEGMTSLVLLSYGQAINNKKKKTLAALLVNVY